jgi:hypothetical protein
MPEQIWYSGLVVCGVMWFCRWLLTNISEKHITSILGFDLETVRSSDNVGDHL